MRTNDHIKKLLLEGVNNGVFPGAVLLVAHKGRIVFLQEAGYRSLETERGPVHKHTIFDLASLTKPLATTFAIMKLVDEGKALLDRPISDLLPGTLPVDKRNLTLRLMLSHSAGFPDWKPFYLKLTQFRPDERRRLVREWIMSMDLVYRPGEETLYSDLGFIILEWVVEQVAGMSLPAFLDLYFFGPISLKRTFFGSLVRPAVFGEDQFAATEACPWRKKTILGFVHDENAYALGGYSGHAGLFGTAEEVYNLIILLREHYRGEREDHLKPETVREFLSRQGFADGSTRALGWDTPSPKDSSSGRYFSANSVGHLGFTGTSVWMDLDRDVIVVFLTNRIHPTRNNEKIKAFRPRLHDLVMEELGGDN